MTMTTSKKTKTKMTFEDLCQLARNGNYAEDRDAFTAFADYIRDESNPIDARRIALHAHVAWYIDGDSEIMPYPTVAGLEAWCKIYDPDSNVGVCEGIQLVETIRQMTAVLEIVNRDYPAEIARYLGWLRQRPGCMTYLPNYQVDESVIAELEEAFDKICPNVRNPQAPTSQTIN